jgi:DNA-binding transcriptional MocR family regulator
VSKARGAPKWARAGFASAAEYNEACSKARRSKEATLRASNARCGAARVLEYLVRRSDFHNMAVTTTKPQIMEDLRLDRKTVQRALKFLREEGTICAITNAKGGKAPGGAGLPVTYVIATLTPLEDMAPEPKLNAHQMTREELRELSELQRLHGYGEASRIMQQRRGVG